MTEDPLQVAIELALAAEAQGNLPVGAVIVLDGQIIAKGANAVLQPHYHPGHHAEMMALAQVPVELWPRAAEMSCYTTLEPCLMCFGSLLLHGVGSIYFGADDPEGGFRWVSGHLPPYYGSHRPPPRWQGPLRPEVCDPLFRRTQERFVTLPCSFGQSLE